MAVHQERALNNSEQQSLTILQTFGDHWTAALAHGGMGYFDLHRQSDRAYELISERDKATGLSQVTFRELLLLMTGGDMEWFKVQRVKQESSDRIISSSIALIKPSGLGYDSLYSAFPFSLSRRQNTWGVDFLDGIGKMTTQIGQIDVDSLRSL